MIKRLIWTIWTQMSSVLKKADKLNLSLSPGWRGIGGVLTYWSGRAGGQLPDFAEGIIRKPLDIFSPMGSSIWLSWPKDMQHHDHLPYMGLPMIQNLVKSGTSGVQTLQNAYLQNSCTDLLYSKFCGIVWTCNCAMSWSFSCLPHISLSMGPKLGKSSITGEARLCRTYINETTWWIYTIQISMDLSKWAYDLDLGFSRLNVEKAIS